MPYKINSNYLELGIIGEVKPHLEINSFNQVAIPVYKQKVKLNKKLVPFSKQTFNAYKKSCALQGKEVHLTDIDSLLDKPHFITLEIADKLAIIDALKKDENEGVLAQLKYNKELKLIQAISLCLDEEILNSIRNAESVFLTNNTYKNYHFELVTNGKVIQTIPFSSGTVFAYQLNSFCWQKTSYNEELIALIGEKEKCSGNDQKQPVTQIKF